MGLLKIVIINRLGLVRLTFMNLEAFPFCFLSKRSFVFGVDEDNQNLLVGGRTIIKQIKSIISSVNGSHSCMGLVSLKFTTKEKLLSNFIFLLG